MLRLLPARLQPRRGQAQPGPPLRTDAVGRQRRSAGWERHCLAARRVVPRLRLSERWEDSFLMLRRECEGRSRQASLKPSEGEGITHRGMLQTRKVGGKIESSHFS